MLNLAKLYIAAVITVAIFLNSTNSALAQNRKPSEPVWDSKMGGGVGLVPNYEGSPDHSLAPIPYIMIRWKDFIMVGTDGLKIELEEIGEFDAGIGLGFDAGRSEDGKGILGNSNDDSILGMGDIGLAPGVRAYFEYDFAYIDIGANVSQFFGADNNGLLAEMILDKSVPLTEKWRIVPTIKATWADTDYMQTFFGVSTEQSALSQFPQYSARKGFKDVSFNLNIMYAFNQNWFVFLNGQIKKLLNDAADSPVSRDDTNTLIASGVAYMF